ncbi:MAG TPA: ABC transporter ATP-binding protein, partial [Acidimicrobiales bacterium]|nr:ABC transporter ATP-binding protein [Acidimicrobiales bacterium]
MTRERPGTTAVVGGPRVDDQAAPGAVLEVRGLTKHFDISRSAGGGRVHAVDDVDLRIGVGEILGLVGETGSGKSTVAKCIVRLLEPSAGAIFLHGWDIAHASGRRLRRARRAMHMVFQDPFSSLDPRTTVSQLVAEPLRMHRVARGPDLTRRVDAMLDRVGLAPDVRYRFPHELSGGQRQRVGLARSLVLEPSLLIADEPVSALDVSVQASILNLLVDLQQRMGFSCLFVAHDLATVEFACNRVAVMYLGRIVEEGPREAIFGASRHPYTASLLSAAPVPDPADQRTRRRIVLRGDIPSPIDPPPGCRFHTRCPVASLPRCATEAPVLEDPTTDGHPVACHLVGPDGRGPDLAAQ